MLWWIRKKSIWQLSSILTQVDNVWHLFDNYLKNYQDWFGWIIVYLKRCCFSSQKKQGIKYPFKYKYVISFGSIRKEVTDNHNFAKLLKYVNNKLTVSEVTQIDQYIVESTMLDNKLFIYSIDEFKVVVVILNEPLEDDTVKHSKYFLSQIEIVNCKFEIWCGVITKNIYHLVKCISEVYSRHGGEFQYYWYQHR